MAVHSDATHSHLITFLMSHDSRSRLLSQQLHFMVQCLRQAYR
jgi:hypothetical protein